MGLREPDEGDLHYQVFPMSMAMSCGGASFSPSPAGDSAWDSVTPMAETSPSCHFQFSTDHGYVCMLNHWFSCNDENCAQNCNFFQINVERVTVDKIIKVMAPKS